MSKFTNTIVFVLVLLLGGAAPAAAQTQDDVNARMLGIMQQMDVNLRALQAQNRALQEEIRQLREELRQVQQVQADFRSRLAALERHYGLNGSTTVADVTVTPAVYSSTYSPSRSGSGTSGTKNESLYRPVNTSSYWSQPAYRYEYKPCPCGCGCYKKY